MGIDWNWIFQRPQILALELQKQYEVTVLCPRQFVQNKHQKKNIMPDRLGASVSGKKPGYRQNSGQMAPQKNGRS